MMKIDVQHWISGPVTLGRCPANNWRQKLALLNACRVGAAVFQNSLHVDLLAPVRPTLASTGRRRSQAPRPSAPFHPTNPAGPLPPRWTLPRSRNVELRLASAQMSVLLRTRVASFLSGVAVTGVYAVYELRKDLVEGHQLLVKQVRAGTKRGAEPRPLSRGGRRCAVSPPTDACSASLLPWRLTSARCCPGPAPRWRRTARRSMSA